jgi:hypothetical protein
MPGFPLVLGSDWAGGRDHTPSRVPQRWGTTSCREAPTYLRQLQLTYVRNGGGGRWWGEAAPLTYVRNGGRWWGEAAALGPSCVIRATAHGAAHARVRQGQGAVLHPPPRLCGVGRNQGGQGGGGEESQGAAEQSVQSLAKERRVCIQVDTPLHSLSPPSRQTGFFLFIFYTSSTLSLPVPSALQRERRALHTTVLVQQ